MRRKMMLCIGQKNIENIVITGIIFAIDIFQYRNNLVVRALLFISINVMLHIITDV